MALELRTMLLQIQQRQCHECVHLDVELKKELNKRFKPYLPGGRYSGKIAKEFTTQDKHCHLLVKELRMHINSVHGGSVFREWPVLKEPTNE